jgi:hypothetical protein
MDNNIINECSICLENLNDNITITTCNHTFHIKCLYSWFYKNYDCPDCRTKLIHPHKKFYCAFCDKYFYRSKKKNHKLCDKCNRCNSCFHNKEHHYCESCDDCFDESHILHSVLRFFKII